MKTFLMILAIPVTLVAINIVYYSVIVPLHFRYAKKTGCGYDPEKNRFTHGEHCVPPCWCLKYTREEVNAVYNAVYND